MLDMAVAIQFLPLFRGRDWGETGRPYGLAFMAGAVYAVTVLIGGRLFSMSETAGVLLVQALLVVLTVPIVLRTGSVRQLAAAALWAIVGVALATGADAAYDVYVNDYDRNLFAVEVGFLVAAGVPGVLLGAGLAWFARRRRRQAE